MNELHQTALQGLIDRELVVEYFNRYTAGLSSADLDKLVDQEVATHYGGNRTQFLKSLAEHHLTLESYKKEASANLIFEYLRGRHTLSDWDPFLKNLRSQAKIQINT